MEEFGYIQAICDEIVNQFGQLPITGCINYTFEFEIVDDEVVDYISYSVGFDYLNYRKNTGDVTWEMSDVLKKNMTALREVMATKHKDGSKWSEAVMTFEKGGAVKMTYKYPDKPDCTSV